MMGGGPAGIAALGGLADKVGKSEKGAKANTNMMQTLQQIDPFQKMAKNLGTLVQAAIPLGGAVDEALSEVTDIFTGAFMEGFAPAMDVIINTLTKPEVLTAITQIGMAFADLFIALAPLVEFLLPAFIWLIGAITNVIIMFINIIIWIWNEIFVNINNFFGGDWQKIPRMNYVGETVAAASGADFLTNGPTSILAGEAGQEHVSITPVGEESSGGRSITVNINAGTIITERDLADTIRRTVDDVMRENTLLK